MNTHWSWASDPSQVIRLRGMPFSKCTACCHCDTCRSMIHHDPPGHPIMVALCDTQLPLPHVAKAKKIEDLFRAWRHRASIICLLHGSQVTVSGSARDLHLARTLRKQLKAALKLTMLAQIRCCGLPVSSCAWCKRRS